MHPATRITIRIPRAQARALAALADARGDSVATVVRELLRGHSALGGQPAADPPRRSKWSRAEPQDGAL